MFQAYKEKACIQFEDNEDLTIEKHSKNLKCTVKVKSNAVKVTQQSQRIFIEFKEYQMKDQMKEPTSIKDTNNQAA